MPKKIFAVTNVKVGSGPGEFVAAGEEIDSNLPAFNKKILLELHSQGAIEVRTVEDEEPVVDDSVETPKETVTTEGTKTTPSNSETGASE